MRSAGWTEVSSDTVRRLPSSTFAQELYAAWTLLLKAVCLLMVAIRLCPYFLFLGLYSFTILQQELTLDRHRLEFSLVIKTFLLGSHFAKTVLVSIDDNVVYYIVLPLLISRDISAPFSFKSPNEVLFVLRWLFLLATLAIVGLLILVQCGTMHFRQRKRLGRWNFTAPFCRDSFFYQVISAGSTFPKVVTVAAMSSIVAHATAHSMLEPSDVGLAVALSDVAPADCASAVAIFDAASSASSFTAPPPALILPLISRRF